LQQALALWDAPGKNLNAVNTERATFAETGSTPKSVARSMKNFVALRKNLLGGWARFPPRSHRLARSRNELQRCEGEGKPSRSESRAQLQPSACAEKLLCPAAEGSQACGRGMGVRCPDSGFDCRLVQVTRC
jgi:hypothetical protein